MIDYLYAEAMVEQLARDRDAHMRRHARLAALNSAGTRSATERSRKRREHVARLLKALAFRLAPPVITTGRTERPATTIT